MIKLHSLIKRLSSDLPGTHAQQLMAPSLRHTSGKPFEQSTPKNSAVLLLLYPVDQDYNTVFIERTPFGPHAGQISLPGGRMDPGDPNLTYTALREAEEEVGVSKHEIQVLGALSPLYVPNSNFNINPVIGFIDYRPDFVPEPSEVKSIIEISPSQLFHPSNKNERIIKRNGYTIQAPFYNAHGHEIWGATAMILSEFEVLCQ